MATYDTTLMVFIGELWPSRPEYFVHLSRNNKLYGTLAMAFSNPFVVVCRHYWTFFFKPDHVLSPVLISELHSSSRGGVLSCIG